MALQQIVLYNDQLDYEENKAQGPFGSYEDGKAYANIGEPKYEFFGVPVSSPFGIAAGPLSSNNLVKAVLDKGYDIVTLKSVRTASYPCNVMPQVRPVKIQQMDLQNQSQKFEIDTEYRTLLAVANSFGIPSVDPSEWQPLMKQAFTLPGNGQSLLVAFQGTTRGEGDQAFIDDHVKGIRLIRQTGAKTIEINLSCPNEGSPVLLCFDILTCENVIKAVRDEHPDINLIVKITYFVDKQQLKNFVTKIGPLVDGISANNTIGRPVVDEEGKEVFPGRPTAGISGAPIKQAGIETVSELARLRKELGLSYKILGIGGVLSPVDFQDYLDAGADFVFSVTGAMWNSMLAQEIKADLL